MYRLGTCTQLTAQFKRETTRTERWGRHCRAESYTHTSREDHPLSHSRCRQLLVGGIPIKRDSLSIWRRNYFCPHGGLSGSPYGGRLAGTLPPRHSSQQTPPHSTSAYNGEARPGHNTLYTPCLEKRESCARNCVPKTKLNLG